MKCPKCQSEVMDSAKFCTKCGCNIAEETVKISEDYRLQYPFIHAESLTTEDCKYCKKCGAVLMVEAKFCTLCGAPYDAVGNSLNTMKRVPSESFEDTPIKCVYATPDYMKVEDIRENKQKGFFERIFKSRKNK